MSDTVCPCCGRGAPAGLPGGEAFDGPRPGTDSAPLSEAARRHDEALQVPIRTLPIGRSRDRAFLGRVAAELNGAIASFRAGAPDAGAFPVASGAVNGDLDGSLWTEAELRDLRTRDLEDLEVEWRRRLGVVREGRVARRVLRGHQSFAAIWRQLPEGDFDRSGRGTEYTSGMACSPACRWLGVRTLLGLLGGLDRPERLYLDVLGGNGYIWRLVQADSRLASRCRGAAPTVHQDGDGRSSPSGLHQGSPGSARHSAAQAAGNGDASVPAFLDCPLLSRSTVAASGKRPFDGSEDGSSRDGAGPAFPRTPEIIINDVSHHMFEEAGLWGVATREDASRLSRTFRGGCLDGILLAYGTHHISDLGAAVREAHTVLKPGGVIVLHDFLDEGPVGRWFHEVVHPHSKTGHALSHIAPVRMAALLYAAGYHRVELFEISDPFVFSSHTGSSPSLREIAWRYIVGMYGLAGPLAADRSAMEDVIRSVLAYPELGDLPHFSDELVYIPRRAMVARATKPAAGGPLRFQGDDLALMERLGELLRRAPAEITRRAGAPSEVARYWFQPRSYRWGLSPDEQRRWFDVERRARTTA